MEGKPVGGWELLDHGIGCRSFLTRLRSVGCLTHFPALRVLPLDCHPGTLSLAVSRGTGSDYLFVHLAMTVKPRSGLIRPVSGPSASSAVNTGSSATWAT
jgi:hypothetical protein